MNDSVSPISGYRIVGERKQDRQLSLSYLALKPEAAHALDKLRRKVDEEERKKDRGVRGAKGVPCVAHPDDFSGDELLSERDAQLACSPCPAKELCKAYALIARPAHGVWGGTVREMNIPDD